MALRHETGQPLRRVGHDLVESTSRVPVTEVARPAAQETVHVSHHDLDRQQQPLARRELTDTVAGMLPALT